jgi:PAS domain S-box-containing protein
MSDATGAKTRPARAGAAGIPAEWAGTPLGPPERWSPALRAVAGLVLATPHPMVLAWGPELRMVYNSPYTRILGHRHPRARGRPFLEVWEGERVSQEPLLREVLEEGGTFRFEDQRFLLDRRGYTEEAFFSSTYSPVPGEDGGTAGVLITVAETTDQVLARRTREAERRLGVELDDERTRRSLALEAGLLGDWELDLRSNEAARRSARHDEIFGYVPPRVDWSFEIFLDHVHPEDRTRVTRAFEEALATRTSWDFECRITRADGEPRWIWASGQVVLDADGNSRRMLGIVADITDRKRSEEALQRYAEQFRGLAAAAASIHSAREVEEMLSLITEQARHLIGAHQAVSSMTMGEGAAQGINNISLSEKYAAWRDFTTPPDGSGIYRLVTETNRSLRLTQEELEAHPAWRGFGEHAAAHPPLRGWLAAPMTARDGANLGLIQLSDRYEGDFTESDEAVLAQLAHLAAVAIENARLFREAEQANRAKSEFLAAMSHELRTPLNAVGGYVEILEMGVHGALTPEQQQALQRIGANQRHLLSLINDVLAFARLEAGRLEFDVHELTALETITSLEALVAPQAAARGIAYTVERCEPDLRFQGDEERVRQILLNLVGNAIKFTPEGGWVVVACHTADGEVDFEVRDCGPGIEPEEQSRIFDPFQQVGRRLNRPQGGVGLGLAISRDLARGMGGDVTVRSEPGSGSTFTLRLPRGG